jgi:hypothetical protein
LFEEGGSGRYGVAHYSPFGVCDDALLFEFIDCMRRCLVRAGEEADGYSSGFSDDPGTRQSKG